MSTKMSKESRTGQQKPLLTNYQTKKKKSLLTYRACLTYLLYKRIPFHLQNITHT